jgi:superoxide dismutase, Cu-Zn family
MKTSSLFSVLGGGAIVVAFLLISPLASAGEVTKAIAVLHSTSGSNVTGTVTFTKSGEEVKVVADVTGLTPGKHGFHIHEFGDCSAPDAKSAGGHFNPSNHQHGAPDATDRHAGDLGNIEADASGKAHLEWSDKMMKLSGDDSIVGHAVIVHEKADDLKTQPTGDAGGRVACGVIGVAKP